MSLLDKFRPLAEAREALTGGGIDPFSFVVDRILSATEAIVNGRRTILVGTNNYLGLTVEPACVEAAVHDEDEGLRRTLQPAPQ